MKEKTWEEMKLELAVRDIDEIYRSLSKQHQQSIDTMLELSTLYIGMITPLKPRTVEDKMYCCPRCGNNLLRIWKKYPTEKTDLNEGLPYCLSCGQEIDWSGENEECNDIN